MAYRYRSFWFTLTPVPAQPMHRHPYAEVFVIEQGQATLRVERFNTEWLGEPEAAWVAH
jgi:D-lyxose ketol-isomerase